MSGLPGMGEYSPNRSRWDSDDSSEAGSQQDCCEILDSPRAAAAAAPAPAGLWRASPAGGGGASSQQLAAGRNARVGALPRVATAAAAAAAVGPLATAENRSAALRTPSSAQGAAASRVPTTAERRAADGEGSAAGSCPIPAPVQAGLRQWLQGAGSPATKKARLATEERAKKKRAERVQQIANTLLRQLGRRVSTRSARPSPTVRGGRSGPKLQRLTAGISRLEDPSPRDPPI